MSKIRFELDTNKYEAFYDGESCELYKNEELFSVGLLSDVIDELIEQGFSKEETNRIYKELKL